MILSEHPYINQAKAIVKRPEGGKSFETVYNIS